MRTEKAWTTLGWGCQAFSLKRADEVMMYKKVTATALRVFRERNCEDNYQRNQSRQQF